MTTYQITGPKRLQATVKLPASKSISNRALIIHALSGGTILPENLSDCDDTEVIIQALKNMPEVINIKAAGTAMRFMNASGLPFSISWTNCPTNIGDAFFSMFV